MRTPATLITLAFAALLLASACGGGGQVASSGSGISLTVEPEVPTVDSEFILEIRVSPELAGGCTVRVPTGALEFTLPPDAPPVFAQEGNILRPIDGALITTIERGHARIHMRALKPGEHLVDLSCSKEGGDEREQRSTIVVHE